MSESANPPSSAIAPTSDPQSDPQSNVTDRGNETPGASQSPPQSNEQKRGRGVHNPECKCTFCNRKLLKAEKKSGSPNPPKRPFGENSQSSSTRKSHLPSQSKPSTSPTMAKKIAAMKNSNENQQCAQSPQQAAEASMAHSPKEGNWFDRLTSGWSTVIG